MRKAHLKRTTVDTTVQDQAVSYPTDSELLIRSRKRLVKLCRQHKVGLRQCYAKTGPKAVIKSNRCAHARQFRQMHREIRRLNTILGRLVRDIERRNASDVELRKVLESELTMTKRLLAQKRHDSNKLYSLHAPEVECITKGNVMSSA